MNQQVASFPKTLFKNQNLSTYFLFFLLFVRSFVFIFYILFAVIEHFLSLPLFISLSSVRPSFAFIIYEEITIGDHITHMGHIYCTLTSVLFFFYFSIFSSMRICCIVAFENSHRNVLQNG